MHNKVERMKLVELSEFTQIDDTFEVEQVGGIQELYGSRMMNSDEVLELRLWKEWMRQSLLFHDVG